MEPDSLPSHNDSCCKPRHSWVRDSQVHPMCPVHNELEHYMYDLCECGRPVTQGRANLVWKMKTGKKHFLNDTSLIALWQGRIEFSPLTETAFFKN